MLNITNLFGKSPIAPLQVHMGKVASCVLKLPDLFKALKSQDYVKLQKLADEISTLEHQADIAKGDIRNNIPGKLFFSLSRSDFLEMVDTQDSLADAAENISVLLTLKKLELPPSFIEPLDAFLKKNIEAFHLAQDIVKELPDLIEYSFGGIEAAKVRLLIQEVALREHEADVLQLALLKALLEQDTTLSVGSFYLWQKIFQEVGMLSNLSEKLGSYFHMMLEKP